MQTPPLIASALPEDQMRLGNRRPLVNSAAAVIDPNASRMGRPRATASAPVRGMTMGEQKAARTAQDSSATVPAAQQLAANKTGAAQVMQAAPTQATSAPPAFIAPAAGSNIAQSAARTSRPLIPSATSSVAQNLTSLLGEDGLYVQQARSQAAQAANERGVLNSAMAAGAGQAAAIGAALPIAAQDAAQTWQTSERLGSQSWQTSERLGSQQFSAGENALDRALQKSLQSSQQTWQSGENALDRTQQTALQTSGQQFTAGENALDRTQQTALQTSGQQFTTGENALDRAQQDEAQASSQDFQREMQTLSQNFNATESQLSRDFQLEIGKLNISAADKQTAQAGVVNALANIEARRTADLRTIQTDPNMDAAAKQSQIAALNSRYDDEARSAVGVISSVYSANFGDLYPAASGASSTIPSSGATNSNSNSGSQTNGGSTLISDGGGDGGGDSGSSGDGGAGSGPGGGDGPSGGEGGGASF